MHSRPPSSDFRRLNSTYDAIIIDDADIHEFEETQLLSHAIWSQDASVLCTMLLHMIRCRCALLCVWLRAGEAIFD